MRQAWDAIGRAPIGILRSHLVPPLLYVDPTNGEVRRLRTAEDMASDAAEPTEEPITATMITEQRLPEEVREEIAAALEAYIGEHIDQIVEIFDGGRIFDMDRPVKEIVKEIVDESLPCSDAPPICATEVAEWEREFKELEVPAPIQLNDEGYDLSKKTEDCATRSEKP